MSDNDAQASPGAHDGSITSAGTMGGNGMSQGGADPRGVKRQRQAPDDDDDDDDNKPGGRERRKIEIKFIQDKSRRHITFSKRKAGIMKKAYELSVLTGTQVLLLVVSETGLVYTFTTPKLQPLVTKAEGKNLIQACLNAPEPSQHLENGAADLEDAPESPEDPSHAHIPAHMNRDMPQTSVDAPGYAIHAHQQAAHQQAAYQQYLQAQHQAQAQRQYAMPPGATHLPQSHSAQAS